MHRGFWWGNKERGHLEYLSEDGRMTMTMMMMMMIVIVVIIIIII
jgi:hypothetical protein